MSIDASEMTALAAKLLAASAKSLAASKAVMSKAGLNVKNDARARASGIPHASGYPYSIKYEVKGLEVEIGPEIGGPQWGLGDIFEWGTPVTAARPHMMPAAEAELPKMEKALAALAVKAL